MKLSYEMEGVRPEDIHLSRGEVKDSSIVSRVAFDIMQEIVL
jgi:hypothetical protein